MDFDSIGGNLRKYRLAKRLRQEDLAEKTGLSSNYIGMVERGEKIPSPETFTGLLNALDASVDIVLADVLNGGYVTKNSVISGKMEKLSSAEQKTLYEVTDTLVCHFSSGKV